MEEPTRAVLMPAVRAEEPILNRLHTQDLAINPDYLAEDMAIDVTEGISTVMEFRGLSRADLARAMGVSRPYITKMLSAPSNMTLRTIAAAGIALGVRPRVVFPHNISATVFFPAPVQRPLPGFPKPASPRVILAFAGKDEPEEWSYPTNSEAISSTSSEEWPRASETLISRPRAFPPPSTSTAPSFEQLAAS